LATTMGRALDRRLYHFSIEQVEAMVHQGILSEADRVELWDGVLIEKMTKNTPHIVAAARLGKFLHRAVPEGYTICVEATIALPWPGRRRRGSLPEPDVVIVVGDPDTFGRRIGPQDIAVIIEIADTSLAEDRTRTKRRYARAAIPTYWLINLPERRIEVYSGPTGPSRSPDYGTLTIFGEDQYLPLVLGGIEVGQILVRDLLPSAPRG
jgi:Uma2 family endonuclease